MFVLTQRIKKKFSVYIIGEKLRFACDEKTGNFSFYYDHSKKSDRQVAYFKISKSI